MRLLRGCSNTLLVSTLCLLGCSFLASAEILADGLEIVNLNKVECDRPTRERDILKIHYNGTLENGESFDSSYTRNQPFTFKLGIHRVIKGWDEGLMGMCVGEERKLIIPPKLAYGDRPVGPIPAGSTLIFETKLIAIVGVMDAPRPGPTPTSEPIPISESEQNKEGDANKGTDEDVKELPDNKSGATDGGSKPADSGEIAHLDETTKPADSKEITNTDGTQNEQEADVSAADDGECRLLGPFALIVQGGLGLLALFSLVWKRHRERPRRPLKIWFFDVSKQVFGSVLLHMVNLLMSMLSSGEFELKNKSVTSQLKDAEGRSPNPCSFYLLNLAIDTTIGIPILIILLRLLHHGAALTPLARPLESIKSGHYGHPPRATWWLKQSFIYFLGLLLMKLFVFFIFQILPWIAWVGDWALRWTEGSEALQITFVMFIFPLVMNAIQYYIIDSVIKEGTGDDSQHNDHERLPTEDPGDDDDDDENERAGLRRGAGGDVDAYSSARNSLDQEARKREAYDEIAEYDYDEDDDEERIKRGNVVISRNGKHKGKDVERSKSR